MNKPISHILLIIILGLLAYSNTFSVPFHFDDMPNIVENYKLGNLNNFWPPSGSRWFGFLTFALNYYFGGLNVTGYHIVNLTIHILNAILVYLLVILTFKTPYFSASNPTSPPFSKGGMGGFALFSALLFVSHPVQTQAVTYIVQRFTSLATLFYLLSLVMYIKWRLVNQSTPSLTLPPQGGGMGGRDESKLQTRRLKSVLCYLTSVVCAVLAMKTKEISFTLPVVIVLYEFMFFEGKFKKRILYLIPLLLTILIIPLSIIGTDKPIGDVIGELREASQETERISRNVYLLTQCRVIITYIRLLFFPINQNVDYDYPIYHSFLNPSVFLSFLFLLFVFCIGGYLLYRSKFRAYDSGSTDYSLFTIHCSRLVSFGIFWFFITLSVESSIIPISDVIFEHRLYLPNIGIIIAFCTAIFYILRFKIHDRFSLATAYSLLTTVVIVFSIVTYQRNTVWKDSVSLCEDVVRKSPNKARSHYNLGVAYYEQGRIDEAIGAYETALKITYAFSTDMCRGRLLYVYNNLGVVYAKQGRIDEAIGAYETALKISPDDADIHYNLALAYAKQGRIDEAISEFQIVLNLNPNDAGTRQKLDDLYVRRETIKNSRGEK